MTTPTEVPTTPPPAPETVAAVADAITETKKARAKRLATTVASRVGVPIVIGTAAAYVTARRLSRLEQEESYQGELTSSTDE